MENKFYTYYQNSSGGHQLINYQKGIGKNVIIEAYSLEEANKRAEEIGLYFDIYTEQDCDCCGHRWTKLEEDNTADVQSVPSINRQSVINPNFFVGYERITYPCFIHYLNGNIVTIEDPKKF